MTSTPHPKPLQLAEPQEVLLNKMERVAQNVLDLHPLLHLLNAPENGKESLGDRLANLLLDVKTAVERNSQEMAELKEAVQAATSGLKGDMTAISNRMHRMEQQAAQIGRMLNLKLD